ncbi:MAG: hypothetical protein ABSG19_14955 [Candidatus Aminicenantales bacterium]
MIIWIFVVAGGLIFSLAGMFLIFIAKPPTVDLARARQTPAEWGREMMKDARERSLLTPEQIKAASEEEARKEEQKLKFSVAGVGLLILGAIAQLVGTVAQAIILASRG